MKWYEKKFFDELDEDIQQIKKSFKPSKLIGIVANNTKYGFYLLNAQSEIKLSSKSILWIKISYL